jgi:hypothetical protein
MTYTCSAWEFTSDSYLMKLQRLPERDGELRFTWVAEGSIPKWLRAGELPEKVLHLKIVNNCQIQTVTDL